MSKVSTFVGLDVHKNSISVAFTSAGSEEKAQSLGKQPNDYTRLRKLLLKLGSPKTIKVCYEAGPTGYGLYRKLCSDGFVCEVIAPAKTPRVPTDRVKTDKRDAKKIATFARSGLLVAIRVPTLEEEALRDLLRARESFQASRLNLKRRLGSLLLRHDRIWHKKSNWTLEHREWIRKQEFEGQGTNLASLHLQEELAHLDTVIKELEHEIELVARTMPSYDLIQALQGLKGIKLLTAATLVAEIGDFRRFQSAGKLMSFLGLTPSEDSSGDRQNRGAITRAGNGRLRRLVVEAAWAYWRKPNEGKELVARSKELASGVRTISWKAQKRLNNRLHYLIASGKSSRKALIAVARELTGFIWAVAQEKQLLMRVA